MFDRISKRRTKGPASARAISCAGLSLLLFAPAIIGQGTAAKSHGARRATSTRDAAAVSRFSARVDELLSQSPASKGHWGLLVLDGESGETLFEREAEAFFIPASNLKLFTSAFALSKLGTDYRFHTTLESGGAVSSDATLNGDLLLVGRGDPNLSNRKFPFEQREEFDGPPEKALAELADALFARGIRKISGDVIGDDSYFPRERYPSGWELDDIVWQYGAAISAIVVDDNTVALTLSAGAAAGAPVQSMVVPATSDFAVANNVVTSAAGVKADLTLIREVGTNSVVVKGTLPAGSAPRKLTLAIQEPALHAAVLLKSVLEARGIQVSGAARAQHDPAPASLVAGGASVARQVYAEHISQPLGDSVKLSNKISQNLHTEMWLRTAVRQSGYWNTSDDLVNGPSEFYAAAGIQSGDVIQADGSGLSRQDLVTPRAVTSLLWYAQKQPWFGAYYASLPIAGVDGTLEDRMKNTAAAGKIHAKTGSVEHVRTLSGYAELPSGRRIIFSFLGNNQGGKNHEAADALSGLCIALVEEFSAATKPQVNRKR